MNNVISKVKAIVLGDNINTDLLHPPRYFGRNDKSLGKGFLKGLKINIPEARNYVIIAGSNFGAGSSRETTIYAMKYTGIQVIVADSFARIFARSSFNLGLPCWTIKKRLKKIKTGTFLDININSLTVSSPLKTPLIYFKKNESYFDDIYSCGGLMQFMERISKPKRK